MAQPARLLHTQQIHYGRVGIVYGDNGVVKTIVKIPAGSLILKALSGVHITTVFNAGANNYLDIGTIADDDLFGTDLSLTTATFVPLDEAVGTFYCTSETTVTATLGLTGTAATTGAAEVFIAYIPDNDQ